MFTFGTGLMLGIYRKVPALTANTVLLMAIEAPIVGSFVIDLFPLAVWRKGHVKDKAGPNLLVGDRKILKCHVMGFQGVCVDSLVEIKGW